VATGCLVMRSTTLLLALFAVARGHPCDDEHGSLCPEHGPDGLPGCLAAAKADGTSISAGCEAWLTMHDACVDDLAKAPCTGTAYGNDAELCLTSWVRKEDLSEACVGGLPAPPEAAEEEEVDEETKNRRAKRKAARKKAAAEVRKLQEEQAGGGASKSSKKSSSSKSSKKSSKRSSKKGAALEDEMFDEL